MFKYIAANRNSALTTEKNEILNFLGSYFLSIGVITSFKQRKNDQNTFISRYFLLLVQLYYMASNFINAYGVNSV